MGDFEIKDGCLKKYTGSDAEVVIPDGIQELGYGAFSSRKELVRVVIPNSVKSIGGHAFHGCTALTEIVIPAGVTKIGSYAFVACESLVRMEVEPGNPVYHSAGNCIIETATNRLLYGCKTSVLPSHITSIDGSAFYQCRGLTSITVPAAVTSIGIGAWEDCTALTHIEVEPGNPVYHSKDNCIIETKEACLVAGCQAGTIPNGVVSIGREAFTGCKALTDIVIPDSVTRISANAFRNCTNLKKLVIPARVTRIDDSAFAACNALVSIEVAKENPTYHSADNCVIETATNTLILGCQCSVIPNDVTSIGIGAFEYCGLTSIVIPYGVKEIGHGAFAFCTSLTDVVIPDSVNSIEAFAFRGCESLTELVIPNGVQSIGESAFEDSGLTTVTLPLSVTSIGEAAFEYCDLTIKAPRGSYAEEYAEAEGIPFEADANADFMITQGELLAYTGKDEKVMVPEGVTHIGYEAFFASCVEDIVLPSSIRSIGKEAFAYCMSLRRIVMPSSVTSIAPDAFELCMSLVIIAPRGSYAERYAAENHITFLAKESLSS